MLDRYSAKDLEVVRLVEATGSLTEAARQLHISQPAVSHRLSTLQERLGTTLFVRRDGRMQPTPVGERLARAAASIGQIIDQANEDIGNLINDRRRTFRFTTQCHTSVRWMSFLIRDMLDAHDDLSIDFIPEAVADPCGAVLRGDVDIALAYLPDGRNAGREEDVFSDEMFAVMSTSHPLATRRYLNPGNFVDETLVLYGGKRFALVDQVLAPAGVSPARIRQVRLTEAMIELARAGQGIAVLAGWALNDLNSRDGLAAVRIGRAGYRRTWRAIICDECPRELADSFVRIIRRIVDIVRQDDWRRKLEQSAYLRGAEQGSLR